MKKITNKLNMPESLVKAAQNDDYEPGNADYTITTLLNPPLINRLYEKHKKEITEDVSEMLYALFGKSVHNILERADDQMTEERFYITIDGVKISGQLDRYVFKDGKLQDYKICSVWEIIYGIKDNKIEQLNILAELLRQNYKKTSWFLKILKLFKIYTPQKYTVNSGELVLMFRDWSKTKARMDSNYPQTPVVIVNIGLWSSGKAIKFIRERIKLQQDEDYICTAEDRWRKNEKWAVMKRGRKSAIKLHDTVENARRHLDTLDDKHYIEHRPGTDNRCLDYCPVRKFCNYKIDTRCNHDNKTKVF